MSPSRLAVVSVVVLLLGCGSGSSGHSEYSSAPAANQTFVAKQNALAAVQGEVNTAEAALPPLSVNPARKIIYNARLELIVESLEAAEKNINRLATEHGGYLAKSDVRAPSHGEERYGVWTLKIPVERFQPCMTNISGLGELKGSNVDSSDVTEQYYDLEAHVKNNRVEEEGLQKFLLEKSTTGTLDEILKIRKEIRAIRGEIDRQEGQLQRWSNDSSFATITLTIYEREVPVVAAVPVVPKFVERIRQTFFESLEAMLGVFRELTIAVVAIVPWLPMILLVVVFLWMISPRPRKRIASPPGND